METHNVTVRLIYPVTEGGPSTSASDGQVGDEQVGHRAIEGEIEGSNVEDEEIARRPRIARRPQMPTKAEVDAHIRLSILVSRLCRRSWRESSARDLQ